MSKPLTILFDANPIVNGKKSGVGYYTYYLIEALAKNYPDDVALVGHYFNFLGTKGIVDLPTAPNISYVQSKIIPGKILSITRRLGFQPPLELFFKRRGDVALFTNFFNFPSIFRIPTVVTVHDLCYEDVPQYVSDKNRVFLHKFVPKSVKSAAKVITISESTKQAIKRHYKTPDDKFIITPIPPPAEKYPWTKNDLQNIGVKGKYILFVGNLEPRKNIIGLVKGYEGLPDEVKDKCSLVLAGGEGWHMKDTMDYISALQAKGDKIITTGYVSDSEKSALYTNASLLALASHYEGFGMTILEGMSHKIPTVVSDIPVFKEVAGDGSLYFDKDDPADIARAIEAIISDNKLRASIISKSQIRLKEYSWEKVAENVYKEFSKLSGR